MDISGTNLQEIAMIIPTVPDQTLTIDGAATLRTVSFDGSKFIAGDNNGNIYVSADGASWDGVGSTGSRPLAQPLAYDGTYYYAITAAGLFNPTTGPGYNDLGNARYSTDFSTWTAIDNGNSNITVNNFSTISYNGGQGNTPYQATGIQSGYSEIQTQVNASGGANPWQGVVNGSGLSLSGGPRKNIYGADRWVILCDDVGGVGGSDTTFRTKIISLANANVITSSDIVFTGNFREYYSTAAYGNGIFLAAPQGYSSTRAANVVLTSSDGNTWTRSNVASWPANVFLSTALTYASDTQTWAMLIRSVSSLTTCTGIWTSTNNGNTWSNIAPTEGNNQWWSMAYGAGRLVAVGANGSVCIRNGY